SHGALFAAQIYISTMGILLVYMKGISWDTNAWVRSLRLVVPCIISALVTGLWCRLPSPVASVFSVSGSYGRSATTRTQTPGWRKKPMATLGQGFLATPICMAGMRAGRPNHTDWP